jgi:hypothetical protein
MDCHSISAGFTPTRLLELFHQILSQEREALVVQSIESSNSMREVRRTLRHRVKQFQIESDEELRPLYADNRDLRKRFHELASFNFDVIWMHKRTQAHRHSQSDRYESAISWNRESIGRVSQTSRELSTLFEDARNDISEWQAIHRTTMAELQRTISSITERQKAQIPQSPILEKSYGELKAVREVTNHHHRALSEVVGHLNRTQKIQTVPIEISDLRRHVIHKVLKTKVEQVRSDISSRYDQSEPTAIYVQAEIDRRVREKEAEYFPRFLKQKETMAKLESSLRAAEKRLARLLEFDAVVDPSLLDLLAKSRQSMEGMQERTDILMRKLQESTGSSLPSGDL